MPDEKLNNEVTDPIIAEYTRTTRALLGELARLLARAEVLHLGYWTDVAPRLQAQAPKSTDLIADGTGLAGAAPMTVQELQNAMGYIEALLALNTQAHRQAYIKAAGLQNVMP